MEGLIPFIMNAMKKQRPQTAYRCLSESSSGRSYHLLRDSTEGSSHRRTRSEFPPASAAESFPGSDHFTGRNIIGPVADNGGGIRQRNYHAPAARITDYSR